MTDDVHGTPDVPSCLADGTRMTATIMGWRCSFCGAFALPSAA
ncbi:hypothetical protein QDR37_11680 [Amnibacterium sp. CER49]|nr:hypothetical protein [Amnibacterium sp. CER49]MDH2444606.1 hypothetical protein [Amnibacterium sp. CER49]